MFPFRWKNGLVVLLAGSIQVGCSDASPFEINDNSNNEGSLTKAAASPLLYPGVGFLSWTANGETGNCTAFAIASHTLLTAAHCAVGGVPPSGDVIADTNYTVRFTSPNGGGDILANSFKIQAIGRSAGTDDIMLVWLSTDLPDWVTRYPVATDPNTANDDSIKMTLVGYGPTSWSGTDWGTKRVGTAGVDGWITAPQSSIPIAFQLGDQFSSTVCPRDSGGPVFTPAAGPLPAQAIGVMVSSPDLGQETTIAALLPRHRFAIADAITSQESLPSPAQDPNSTSFFPWYIAIFQ